MALLSRSICRSPLGLKVALVLPLLWGLGFGAGAAAPEVLKVEPPHWWTGSTVNPLRLLVRGKALDGARVRGPHGDMRISDVMVNPSGTWLFVSVACAPAIEAGNYPLILETPGGTTSIPFHLERRLDASRNFQGISPDDVIYLIMTDRFANGDPANDIAQDAPPGATDRSNPRAYHGGDLRGVLDRLPYLRELGVTALWLTPWHDNWNGINQCDRPWCPNTYYHGYHAVDYYRVEDRFGDLALLRELVRRAHQAGLKIIQDQVANHVGSRHPWVLDPPLPNWFHGTPADHLRNHFRADLILSPHASESARRPILDGWFDDDMPDLNQEEPEVARYLIQNALWWAGATGLDGIRQDTVQYMPRTFIRRLRDALRLEFPNLWLVGEVFDRDPAHTAFFLGGRTGWDGVDTGLDSVFDFPLWQTSLDVFTGRKPARALRDMLKYDALYSDASRLTVLANNHDVPRFLSLEGATIEGAMLHAAFILTARGIPQLYYGEEIGMLGGPDPDNRRDFPGGFQGDARDAFAASGRTAQEQRLYQWTRDWIELRRRHGSLRRGQTVDLVYDEDAYVFARRYAGETTVVALNRGFEAKRVRIPAGAIEARAGDVLQPLKPAGATTLSIERDLIEMELPARHAVAYRREEP